MSNSVVSIECRAEDGDTREILASLNDPPTRATVAAERALLEHLRGGCMAPIGALGRVEAGKLSLSAVVLSADGGLRLTASEVGSLSEAKALGIRVADVLLAQGAAELIAASRNG